MAAPWKTMAEIRALPPAEGAVLMGLAASGLAMANGRLAQTLARAGCWPEARAWAANPRLVQELLLRLRERGLAEEHHGFWRACPSGLESAARVAGERGLLKRLYQAGLGGGDSTGLAPDGERRARAELRATLLGGPPERWLPLRERFSRQFAGEGRDPLAPLCSEPFEAAWFETLPAAVRAYGCNALVSDALLGRVPEPGFLNWLEAGVRRPDAGPLALPFTLHQLLQGRTAEARGWLEAQPAASRRHPAWLCLEGLVALAEGDPVRALERYDAALKALAPAGKSPALAGKPPALAGKTPRLPTLHAPFHVLALLGCRQAATLRLAGERAALLPQGVPALVLTHLVQVLAGTPPDGDLDGRLPAGLNPLEATLAVVAAQLAGETLRPDRAEAVLAACMSLPLGWFREVLQERLRRQQGEPSRPCALLDLVPARAPWEKRLDQLTLLGETSSALLTAGTEGKPVNLR